jgi:tripartite-type tricarboxylate transporter receptor subunit TctC
MDVTTQEIALRAIAILSRNVLAAFLSLWLFAPSFAQEAAFPTRPVQIVVPFPPGGSSDFVTRILAEKIGPVLGQQVVVLNRPGAAGTIGTQSVAAAAPDGYTLVVTSVGALVIAPALAKSRPYDTLQDFAPITLVAKVSEATMASAKSGITSFAQFITVAKANPGKLSYGSTGVGSIVHLATEQLKKDAGIDLVHVPYTGGATSLSDLLSGRIEIMINDLPAYLPHIRAGTLVALAVNSAQRADLLPDVPTTAEVGYPSLISDNWFGLLAPARTPPAILARLNRVVADALNDPGVKAEFARDGVTAAAAQTPDEFRAFMTSEETRWNAIIKTVFPR